MQRTTMDLWVGIFVMAGIGALLLLALKVGNLGTYSAADSYTLVGNFENIGGLKVRAPIKSAGVVVGRVTDIQLNTETFDAAVTMNIDSRYKFPKDTFASILTSGSRRTIHWSRSGWRRSLSKEWRQNHENKLCVGSGRYDRAVFI